MKRSTERILTTHIGSLQRPDELLDILDARLQGQPVEDESWHDAVARATRDVVKRQVESGIDVVADGEMSKASFNTYVTERLGGIEIGARARDRVGARMASPESQAFPEYYAAYYAEHSSRVGTARPMRVTGPLTYIGGAALQRDIVNLRSAMDGLDVAEAFMPSIAPGFFAHSAMFTNEYYYATQEEAHVALAEALRQEYLAIVDAGFVLQIDDPSLTRLYGGGSEQDERSKRNSAEAQIELLNHALRGIPPDRVRYHTCYGINEGPRVFDIPLARYVDLMLAVNAQALSFEAANPRHEHEYHDWKSVELASDRVLIPGVITHTCAIVEHPTWIAERIVRYAKIVGRENVIAGVDCGFSSQATYKPEIHPTVVWAKFQAMAEGARLASAQLWS
jgi:5-methyltetrahydropteroyltriglutamate--homocysteine methyltransferase